VAVEIALPHLLLGFKWHLVRFDTSLILRSDGACSISNAALLALAASTEEGRVGDGFGVNIHSTQGAAGESQMMAKAFRVARMA
jgi:hypothetical protein